MNSFFPVLQKVAENSLRCQKRRVGDYEIDGILYCGVCRQPRQGFKDFPDPTPTDPDHTTRLKMGIACMCDKLEDERLEREKQAAKDAEVIAQLRSVSLMDERTRESTFESFESTMYNEKNLRLCRRYVENFEEALKENQGLIFWGDVGTGKSFAAACIANALLDKKVPVVMTSFVKLISAIESDRTQTEDLINKLNRAKLVIFDDLGTERCTDAALEKVYNIVDSRYRRMLPMIVTTNVSADDMKREEDIRLRRIYDRLFEVCSLIQFTGPDWRKKGAAKAWKRVAKWLED